MEVSLQCWKEFYTDTSVFSLQKSLQPVFIFFHILLLEKQ